MKQLKELALEKLKGITPNSHEEVCNSIISFSQNNLFVEAKKLLLREINFLDKKGIINNQTPFLLLKAISKYLYNLSISNEYNQSLNEEVKGIIKQIKIILNYLEKNYDEHFLLIKNQNKFFAIENALFLNSADELSTILNHSNYIKEADRFFMLKSKVELGFSRYLFNQKNKVLIEEFNVDGEIKFPIQTNFLIILNNYVPDEVLFKDFDMRKKVWDVYNELEERLLYLKLLKTKNKTKFVKEYKKLKNYLINFPEYLWKEDFFKQYEDITNSINKHKVIESKKINKNEILVNLNSIKTINLIIQLLKD